MLFLGVLATAPIGSSVPGLMLAAVAVQMIWGVETPSSRDSSLSEGYRHNIFFALAGAPSRYCNILRELFTRVGHLLLIWVGGLSALWCYC